MSKDNETATVYCWPKGYASDPQYNFKVPNQTTDEQIAEEARSRYGNWTKVFRIDRPLPPITVKYSEEYIRMMSHDNS